MPRKRKTGSVNGAGKREDSHLGRPAFTKDPGAFVHGRAGGKDIIDQEDLFIFYFFRSVHLESVSDISAPFSAAETRLGLGPQMSFQYTRVYPVPPGRKYFPAEY